MAASSVAEPVGNLLQRNYHNGGNSYTKGNMSYDGRGLIRGGSSAPASNLDSNLEASPKINFDTPVRYVGNSGSALNKEQQTNGSSSSVAGVSGSVSVAEPKIIVLNRQGQVRWFFRLLITYLKSYQIAVISCCELKNTRALRWAFNEMLPKVRGIAIKG